MIEDEEVREEQGVPSAVRVGSQQLSPAASRRQLGAGLRKLRTDANLNLADVAGELERSSATISRLERGDSRPRLVDVSAMLDLYASRLPSSVTPGLRRELLDLARDSRKDAWFEEYRDVLSSDMTADDLQKYIELESDATEFHSFEPGLIPGLLQTRGYASAVAELRFPSHPERQKKRFVDFRMARQRVLDHLRLHVVIGEGAIRRAPGSPKVMIEQLEHIANELRGGRENVVIQIAPVSLPVRAATTGGSFVVMRLRDDPGAADVLCLEKLDGVDYLRTPEVVARYKAAFEDLAASALGRKASLSFIEEVIAEQI